MHNFPGNESLVSAGLGCFLGLDRDRLAALGLKKIVCNTHSGMGIKKTLELLLKVETAFHVLAVVIVVQAVLEHGDLEKAVTQAIALSTFGRVMPTDEIDRRIRSEKDKTKDDLDK